jgi:lipopolysaccharide/colanic/teichoic acid biosynthesis glycosyltransferase
MRLSPGFYQLLTSGMAVTNKTFVPLLTLHPSRIVGIDAWIKSAFDHIVALMALFLTWPAALWIAVWLRLAFVSQPVLRRTRMQGLRGECFELLEFNLDDSTVSLENTRSVMRGIRRAGLQRWPQLFNVLSGQMSMVGPRAIPEGATGHDPAERNNLLAVKPGVLGPWSRHDLTRSPKRVQDELNYVRNWEIWRDIPIVLHAGVALCRRLLTRTE